MDLMYPRVITFRIGGYYRECSVPKFAWKVSLYSQDQVLSPYFASFYQVTRRSFQSEGKDMEFWH